MTLAQLIDCPNEILLKIAAYLDTQSLLQLATTCHRLQPVAQDVLFRSPTVPRSANEFDSRLGCLLRTLIQRPDLADLVRKLSLSPNIRYVEVDVYVSFDPDGRHTLAECIPAFNVAMWEPNIAAAIITRVPNLVDLAVVPDGSSPHRGTDSFGHWDELDCPPSLTPDMFRTRQNPRGNVDITTLRPYQNLKAVRLQSRVLEHQWLKLPNLESLSIAQGTRAFWLPTELPPDANHRVSRLELDLDFLLLLADPPTTLGRSCLREQQLYEFLWLFPKLAHLQINLFKTGRTKQPFASTFGFSNVISRIPKTGCLKVLNITIVPTHEYGRNDLNNLLAIAQPFMIIATLPTLRFLTAPQVALDSPHRRIDLDDILPMTLEVLEVHRVDIRMLDWIKRILNDREHLPSLRRIDLHLNKDGFDDLMKLMRAYKHFGHMKELLQVGIVLKIWWNGQEHVAQWQQEQSEVEDCTPGMEATWALQLWKGA
ncbi:Nn.00g106040.m01.CDS01 [Neocucurbitaria sp. VM-36]